MLGLLADRKREVAGPRPLGMSDDVETAVESFLSEADTVFGEYEQGYMDADAALSRVEAALPELREAVEE